MILRVGVLDQGDRVSFCLVRDISSAGIQAILYSPAVRAGAVLVGIADEKPIAGEVAWVENGHAGIRFSADVDPATLLRLQQKRAPVRRRAMPRVKAASYATVRVGGRNLKAVLRDISSLGARIATSRPLEIGAPASLRLPDLPEVRARVRWAARPDSGLLFETPIPVPVIAQWLDGRLRVGAAAKSSW